MRESVNTMRLVVLCAGPGSLHERNRWTRQDLRAFTLWVVWYGPRGLAPPVEADRVFYDTGSKWDLIRRRACDISGSGASWIWLPDDDVALDVLDVNALFDMCERERPGMAQPSLAPRNVSMPELVHIPDGQAVRFTRFVEIQMPCFGAAVWSSVRELLEDTQWNRSGWGMDCVWSRWPVRKVVHNSIIAVHTRAVNPEGGFYARLGIDPCEERNIMLQKYL